jgi:hypothetical protein
VRAARAAGRGRGGELAWAPRELGLANVRALAFSVRGPAAGSYVFGFAVDPDLGASAADDVASYDPGRGLVLVADAGRAVGILLRDDTGNAIAGLQEYGVGRFAPATGDGAWAAQRMPGVHLVGTPRDVQLVLSAPATSGVGRWLFVLLRGGNPAEVRATADAVLDVVR